MIAFFCLWIWAGIAISVILESIDPTGSLLDFLTIILFWPTVPILYWMNRL